MDTIQIEGRTFKVTPTSCRCGSNWAWVEVKDGRHIMIGCVCHHPLPLNDSPSNNAVVQVPCGPTGDDMYCACGCGGDDTRCDYWTQQYELLQEVDPSHTCCKVFYTTAEDEINAARKG